MENTLQEQINNYLQIQEKCEKFAQLLELRSATPPEETIGHVWSHGWPIWKYSDFRFETIKYVPTGTTRETCWHSPKVKIYFSAIEMGKIRRTFEIIWTMEISDFLK